MIFNPELRRQRFLEGGLEFTLNTKFDENRPMGNVAQHQLADVIRAWLVGLSVEISPVLPRIISWLDLSLANGEDFGSSKNFHLMTLAWAKALATWMLDGKDSPHAWQEVKRFSELALTDDSAFDRGSMKKERLDDYVAFCYQAKEFRRGISEFEESYGVQPLLLSKSLSPRELGYAFCLFQEKKQFSEEDLFSAGKRLLKTYLEDEWLGHGQMIRAATWLKIIYTPKDSDSNPLRTLLSAYENMPTVPRPDFA